jgi:hypothetical protein
MAWTVGRTTRRLVAVAQGSRGDGGVDARQRVEADWHGDCGVGQVMGNER